MLFIHVTALALSLISFSVVLYVYVFILNAFRYIYYLFKIIVIVRFFLRFTLCISCGVIPLMLSQFIVNTCTLHNLV